MVAFLKKIKQIIKQFFRGKESLPDDILFPYWCWVICFGREMALGSVVAIVFSFLNYQALGQGWLSCVNLVPRFQPLFF